MGIVDPYGLTVQNGPFAGMEYPEVALGRTGHLGAKLVGCYEQELAHSIEAFIEQRFETILNIGAGEGYYAVGLAMRSPESVVRAYEIDWWQRRLCAGLADTNGVATRVLVEGACQLDQLDGESLGRVLILCDCEGCELELLQPDRHPMLRTASLLVELHDLVEPTITSEILSRFSATHDAEIISAEQRDVARYEELARMPEADAQLAILERLGAASWGVFRPRDATSPVASPGVTLQTAMTE